jgi:hypothetical protein
MRKSTGRFLLRSKLAPAFERGLMAAMIAAAFVTTDLPAGPGAGAAIPASSQSCDVICDGWINASQP